MIGRLSGILVEKNPPQLVVDVQGVGYEIDVPMSTFYHLPAIGEKVVLFTQLIVREDAHLLYGFGSESERITFRQLLKVSGVGPKVALAVLSGLSVSDLAAAVASQDTAMLVRVPGIGKKTAERLLLELKDKLTFSGPVAAGSPASAPRGSDVLNALLALGYNDREALSAIKQLPADLPVADGIRQALKLLARS
jgi:holliday junction DNA helicase RuvA